MTSLRGGPPVALDRRPHRVIVDARTVFWRVHRADLPPQSFRPPAAPGEDGGRFDGTAEDPYPFLYAAPDQSTAVAETLLRSTRFDGRGYRVVKRAALAGQRLAAFDLVASLTLISLVSATDLATIGQDDWLVQAEPAQFDRTREWGRWLRKLDPDAEGIVWQSRRDRPGRSVVLFGDRCPPGTLVATDYPSIELDSADGIRWLRQILRPYWVTVG